VSSVSLTEPTNEAFADLKEELVADAAADVVTKKKLGVFFWICAGWIVLVAALAITAGLLPLHDPTLGNYNWPQNPGPRFNDCLGTDDTNRDLLSHMIYGTGASPWWASGRAHRVRVGGNFAMFSAYRRGRVDTASTLAHVVLAFPPSCGHRDVSFWGKSLFKITCHRPRMPLIFRRPRSTSYATRDFVLAAKALGASDRRIPAREILPNIMPTIASRASPRGDHHRAGGPARLPGPVGVRRRRAGATCSTKVPPS
jgi:peptide/nickel transport system permease protein